MIAYAMEYQNKDKVIAYNKDWDQKSKLIWFKIQLNLIVNSFSSSDEESLRLPLQILNISPIEKINLSEESFEILSIIAKRFLYGTKNFKIKIETLLEPNVNSDFVTRKNEIIKKQMQKEKLILDKETIDEIEYLFFSLSFNLLPIVKEFSNSFCIDCTLEEIFKSKFTKEKIKSQQIVINYNFVFKLQFNKEMAEKFLKSKYLSFEEQSETDITVTEFLQCIQYVKFLSCNQNFTNLVGLINSTEGTCKMNISNEESHIIGGICNIDGKEYILPMEEICEIEPFLTSGLFCSKLDIKITLIELYSYIILAASNFLESQSEVKEIISKKKLATEEDFETLSKMAIYRFLSRSNTIKLM